VKIYLILFILVSTSFQVVGQRSDIVSDAISDCEGAINILEPGHFSIQFTGVRGRYQDIVEYPSLLDVKEDNSVWCSFIAPFDGTVFLEASLPTNFLQMVIFQQDKRDICKEIHNGKAEIKRLISSATSNEIALSKTPNENQLYSLQLKEDQKINILFNTLLKSKERLKLAFHFEALNNNINTLNGETKIVDLREDEFSPSLNIKVRDASTGFPVITNVNIIGINSLKTLYVGSDFFFEVDKTGKINIKCDAKGYFFVDKLEHIKAFTENEITIWLEPLKVGKSLRLEEIEFDPGTSHFMPTSEVKLRRLKDFMALNSEIIIEIQGHVFQIGANTYAGQKLSEARAKRVLNYLVDNGISKERMIPVGMGNTKPIYPEPKLSYEEQMNRRVEVKIL